MGKLLVCILTSGQLNFLKESVASVINQKNNVIEYDIYIVVNTLSEYYYMEVLECFRNHPKITKIVRTESNGKPGKGHNSVLSIFRETHRYDDLFMLDGDDLLYPYAFYQLDRCKKLDNSDLIHLMCYDILQPNKYLGNIESDSLNIECKFNLKNNWSGNEDEGGNPFIDNMPYDRFQDIRLTYDNPFEDSDCIRTPSRLIYVNRKGLSVLDTYPFLYDTQMNTYDDFHPFMICFKEKMMYDRVNVSFLIDNHVYLYFAHPQSVSHSQQNNHAVDRELVDKYRYMFDNSSFNWDMLSKLKPMVLNNDIFDKNYYKEFFIKNMVNKVFYQNTFVNQLEEILFIDGGRDYNFETPYHEGFGGTEAAILYLANNINSNYKVIIANLTEKTYKRDNVTIISSQEIGLSTELRYVIIQGDIEMANNIKKKHPRLKVYCWQHHDVNVGFILQKFPENDKDIIDGYIYVSNWQKYRYHHKYKVPLYKSFVMQNGISSILEDKLRELSLQQIIEMKKDEIIYMSEAYRGLTLLLGLFPQIYQQNSNIKLKIFSSFKPIRDDNNLVQLEDLDSLSSDLDNHYKDIYKQFILMPGVEFYGKVRQTFLFEQIMTAKLFLYPTYFEETCCTSLLECMACLCNVVTSNRGAIPETLNNLYPTLNYYVPDTYKNIENYITNTMLSSDLPDDIEKNIIELSLDYIDNYDSLDNKLRLHEQYNYIRERCVWSKKPEDFLQIIK